MHPGVPINTSQKVVLQYEHFISICHPRLGGLVGLVAIDQHILIST